MIYASLKAVELLIHNLASIVTTFTGLIMDPAINSRSKAIELWGLKLVEGTRTDERPIICSDTIDFYFEWRADLFDYELINELRTTPLDLELGVMSYGSPGRGLSPEQGHDWIKYFVRITTTLLKSHVDNQEWLTVWLCQVITKLPSGWFQDRLWRHDLTDHLKGIILSQGQVVDGEIGTTDTVSKEDNISTEMKTLLEEIRGFQEEDLNDFVLR